MLGQMQKYHLILLISCHRCEHYNITTAGTDLNIMMKGKKLSSMLVWTKINLLIVPPTFISIKILKASERIIYENVG